jgi:beta-propeller repeat-containing protein
MQSWNFASFAIDHQGNFYITDNQQNVGGSTNQFSKFDSYGKFLWKWGGTGGDLGQFFYPNDIAVDKRGNIYVTSEDVVQKFKPK